MWISNIYVIIVKNSSVNDGATSRVHWVPVSVVLVVMVVVVVVIVLLILLVVV